MTKYILEMDKNQECELCMDLECAFSGMICRGDLKSPSLTCPLVEIKESQDENPRN
jgi:hypothetical protein